MTMPRKDTFVYDEAELEILLWEMKLNWRYEAELEILLLGFNLGTWAAPQLMNVLSSAESKSVCVCLCICVCVRVSV